MNEITLEQMKELVPVKFYNEVVAEQEKQLARGFGRPAMLITENPVAKDEGNILIYVLMSFQGSADLRMYSRFEGIENAQHMYVDSRSIHWLYQASQNYSPSSLEEYGNFG